ncbi:hypothetical protein H3Z83_11825 [Tenacibaculum sp. S7007]|uniref:Knr4/Smi1-like domain-containing protein n=1 Tax=Tenacibaculum pelagium TaxID=2759527 RepID=A0A839AQ47_9FLAO|nr:SMI1/KNR4 family protein [Tenacibaculum pelagium]MBA6157202.1 hypothetical protein [Tenacibaculum pelagium]
MKDLLLFRNKQINVTEFEKKNNLNLPPVYRSFISAFKPYFGFTNCLDESDNIEKEFMTHIFSSVKKENYEIDDDELSFESFIDLEDLLKYDSQKSYIEEFDLLPISYHGHGGSLFIGMKKDNLDKIYYAIDSYEFKFLADNIFDLLSQFRVVTVNYDFEKLDTNKLYKNWNEDFWRQKST